MQVQTCDGARRNRLARQLRSGMVEMNGNSLAAGAPFGGVKASGRAREGGVWGIEVLFLPRIQLETPNISHVFFPRSS
jgi:acyl-CoA reductase-like NAD-dependent aldehyde dehydrogenase